MLAATVTGVSVVTPKVGARRSPFTSELNYTPDQLEFLKAVDKFKRVHGVKFPTACDLLSVAKELGYAKSVA